MFAVLEDAMGDVCVNMGTGLRFRPAKDPKTGMRAGVNIIFPDGSTNITTRGDFEKLTAALGAVNAR